MMRKIQALVCLMCMLAYAEAATVSIGTISAGGDMRVDSLVVHGNATLFDGSTVETTQAAAKLRVDKGVELVLSTDSRGTLYRDHLVLQKGESEIRSSKPFQLEATGLRIVSNTPNSHGFVSTRTDDVVEVSSLTGDFQVTTAAGIALATVQTGKTLVFTKSGDGAGGGQSAPSGTSGISGWTWVFLGGAAAAGVGIGVYLHLHDRPPASR